MTAIGLTGKQAALLAFIESYFDKHGIAPSFEDMKTGLGIRSKSNVHKLIVSLENRGCLARLPHRARALMPIRRIKDMRRVHFHEAAAFIEDRYGELAISDAIASGLRRLGELPPVESNP